MGWLSSVSHAISDAYHDASGAVTGYLGSSTSAYLTPVASYFTADGREQLWGSYGSYLSTAASALTGGQAGGIVQQLGDQYLAAPPPAPPAASGGGGGGGGAYFPPAASTSSAMPVWLWPAVAVAAVLAVITYAVRRRR